MGKNVTYYDMAENDYQFLQFDYEHHRVGNVMCYASQNVCERFLKHIIDEYCTEMDTTNVLKTHSLKLLKKFISANLPDFICDWSVVMQADGFYFSARYPGDDSFIVDEDDVKECWEAVEETRRAVNAYLASHEAGCVDITAEVDAVRMMNKDKSATVE